ncbi:MAG: NAD(P)/FAD-dependent oxidoreductase, partial [Candidatus Pacearchaeota archaeon]|nr:NAD(P)/FAD-dependent oxidoreductase [Candidatus Pacearchaeota archaeon]
MKKEIAKSSAYDFLVIGAGGTGLAAAMYAARLGLKTLVLGKSNGSELPVGGVITTTDSVENYPGFAKISGFELAKKIEEHAREYPLVTIKEEEAVKVEKKAGIFFVKTSKSKYKTKTILFATGTKWRKLDIPGSKEFENKGVHY